MALFLAYLIGAICRPQQRRQAPASRKKIAILIRRQASQSEIQSGLGVPLTQRLDIHSFVDFLHACTDLRSSGGRPIPLLEVWAVERD